MLIRQDCVLVNETVQLYEETRKEPNKYYILKTDIMSTQLISCGKSILKDATSVRSTLIESFNVFSVKVTNLTRMVSIKSLTADDLNSPSPIPAVRSLLKGTFY